MTTSRGPLRVLLIGEGLAFGGALQTVRERGHIVSGIFATSAAEADALRRSNQPVAEAGISPAGFVAEHDCDLLLSIANLHRLDPATLARPRLGAINYHNARLPAYAGLRATAWAILNGESAHGITWHRMLAGIDTGPIVIQRRFVLTPDETTGSLNTRCTAAALESIGDVLSACAHGMIEGEPQDRAERTYFSRSQIVPRAGLIDWTWPAERILRLIRACDWGANTSDFGTATIATPHGPPLFALAGGKAEGAGVPGTILAAAENILTVACGDGAARITLDRASPLRAGAILPILASETLDASVALHRDALLAERRGLRLLRGLNAPRRFGGENTPPATVATGADAARFVHALSEVLGADTIVAMATSDAAGGLLQDWMPIRCGEGIPEAALPLPRDVPHRHPELAGLAEWPRLAAARLLRDGSRVKLASGELAFTPDGRVHHRLPPATIDSILGAMTRGSSPAASREPVRSIVASIQTQALADPCAPAIEHDDRITSRGDLNALSASVAGWLLGSGLRPEASVGVHLPRGAKFVAAALGAMRAGGAYVPLGLASPPARHQAEIEEAGITHAIASKEAIAAGGWQDVELLDIDRLADAANGGPVPKAIPPLDGIAYRIFTSGSSGRPKAVEITHGALANLVAHYLDALPMRAVDRMTMLAEPTFDASVADIWPVLAGGGTLLVPPEGSLLDPAELIDWLAAARASCAFIPTAVAERIIQLPWPRHIALHTLLTGGDALRRRPPPGLPFRLINTYGPTENTVDSLWGIVASGSGRPTIGRPIAGVTAAVIHPDGSELPPGELGELVLGGAQVARGYYGDPALTADRFLLDIRSPGARLYRTGDLVRIGPDGEFEFHGRIDAQVQLRGIRIEPAEIESLLMADRRVRQAACVPLSRRGEVFALLAYVVPTAERPPMDLPAILLAELAQRLPPAVLPRAVLLHTELPMTEAGKIDRRALSALRTTLETERQLGGRDPITALWRELLADASGDDDENFWDAGGDSLTAMELLLGIEAATGVRIPIGRFLGDATPRGIRNSIAKQMHPSVTRLAEGRGPPLICWYGPSGDLDPYQHLYGLLKGREVIGVMSPGLGQYAHIPTSLEEAATLGLEALREFGIAEPVAMLGYSWGGLVTFEAARQLSTAGTPVPFVGLIGTSPPFELRGRRARTLHLLRWGPTAAWHMFRGRRRAPKRILSPLRRAIHLLGRSGALPEMPAFAVHPLGRANVELGRRYRPSVDGAAVKFTLIREAGLRDAVDHLGYVEHGRPDLGWARWAGGAPNVRWVGGDHASVLKPPHVQELALVLQEEIAAAMISRQPAVASV